MPDFNHNMNNINCYDGSSKLQSEDVFLELSLENDEDQNIGNDEEEESQQDNTHFK